MNKHFHIKAISFNIIIMLILPLMARSQNYNPVLTAGPSLIFAPDARGAGLGNTGAATSPDVFSQYWNPAKYIFAKNEKAVSLSYSSWLNRVMQNYSMTYLSGYYQLNEVNSVSMSAGYFSRGKVTMTDNYDDFEISANRYEFYLDGAFSRKISEFLSTSVAVRFMNSNLYNELNYTGNYEVYPGNAFSVSLGGYYRQPLDNGDFALGLNISDIGTKISFDNNATTQFLPANLRFGGSYSFSIDEGKQISVNADVNKLLVPAQNSNADYENTSAIKGVFLSFHDAPGGLSEELSEITFSTGVEYSSNNQLFLRAGYFHEAPAKGTRSHFALGGGYLLGNLQIDMGYVISTARTYNMLDRMLKISLAFNL